MKHRPPCYNLWSTHKIAQNKVYRGGNRIKQEEKCGKRKNNENSWAECGL